MPRDAVPVGMVTGTRTPVALVAVLVLLAGCAGAGTPSVAGGSDGTTGATSGNSTVTVGASASVEAAPDLAVVRVAVETTAESAETTAMDGGVSAGSYSKWCVAGCLVPVFESTSNPVLLGAIT